MLPIHFIDIHEPSIKLLQERFHGHTNISYSVQDIKTHPINHKVFVSPANSLGFMDGGIDHAYSKMFPIVQKLVQKSIRKLGMQTFLGRYYLPVGSAVIVQTAPETYLISAPTMFLPHDVSSTKNAYYAMMASLAMYHKFFGNDHAYTLVVPMLCTGYGKMSPEVAVQQMYQAYIDFHSGNITPQRAFEECNWCYVTDDKDSEQPHNYDNREIKVIEVKET